MRDVPDVSLFAANGVYRARCGRLCGDNDCSGPSPTISGVGGTSASAPAFAGECLRPDQPTTRSAQLGAGERLAAQLGCCITWRRRTRRASTQIKSGNICGGVRPGHAELRRERLLERL